MDYSMELPFRLAEEECSTGESEQAAHTCPAVQQTWRLPPAWMSSSRPKIQTTLLCILKPIPFGPGHQDFIFLTDLYI